MPSLPSRWHLVNDTSGAINADFFIMDHLLLCKMFKLLDIFNFLKKTLDWYFPRTSDFSSRCCFHIIPVNPSNSRLQPSKSLRGWIIMEDYRIISVMCSGIHTTLAPCRTKMALCVMDNRRRHASWTEFSRKEGVLYDQGSWRSWLYRSFIFYLSFEFKSFFCILDV